MRVIWLVVILLIGYGSLYPFNFDWQRPFPADVGQWLLNWQQRTLRSDLIANILLFIPYGFFGALKIQHDKRRSPLLSAFLLVFIGFCYAVILQWIQFLLPSRVPHAADATLNLVGILLGVSAAAYTSSQRIKRFLPRTIQFNLAPALVLLVLWLGWALFPYIPIFASSQLGKGFSELYSSYWQFFDWLQYTAFWLVFFYSLQRVMAKNYPISVLLALSVFILIIKVSMYRSQLSWSEISAVPVALLLIYNLKEIAQLWTLSSIAMVLLLHQFLSPFDFSGTISLSGIQWVPFKGFLGGSTWYHLSNLLEISLLLSMFCYALGRLFSSFKTASILSMAVILTLSVLQLFMLNKTMDVTPIILMMVLSYLLLLLDRERA